MFLFKEDGLTKEEFGSLFNHIESADNGIITYVNDEQYATELNKIYYKYKINKELGLNRQSIINNGEYNHKKIEIKSIKYNQLFVEGANIISKNNKVFTINNIYKKCIGNIVYIYYDIKDKSGKIHKALSQDRLLSSANQICADGNRNIGNVILLAGNIEINWNIVVNQKLNFIYAVEPKTESGFQFLNIRDEFNYNCTKFITSAIVRLFINKHGKNMEQQFLSRNKYQYEKEKSCVNCMACRYKTISDIIEGDANNPDNASLSSFDMKDKGTIPDNIICGYTMESMDFHRIQKLRDEQKRGNEADGYKRSFSEHYNMHGGMCDRFTNIDSEFISNNNHDIVVNNHITTIVTVGFILIFDDGIIDPPANEIKKQKTYTIHTSNFRKSLNKSNTVSIALKAPDEFNGESLSKLAPTWKILNKYRKDNNSDEYTNEYMKILNKLDPEEIAEKLDGKTILCWEEPNEFCHRHLIIKWLKAALSIYSKEI